MQSKRKYKVAIVESDDISVTTLTLDHITNNLPGGADYEYKYALAERLDDILDLKQYEKLTFQWNRDNPNTLGIVLRIE